MPVDLDPLSEAIGQLRAATLAVTKSNDAAWSAIDELRRAHEAQVDALQEQLNDLKTGRAVGIALLGLAALGGGGVATISQLLLPFVHK